MACSGEKLARQVGKSWDHADKLGYADAKKSHGRVRMASKAMQAEFAPVAKKVEAMWIAAASKRGLEAAAALKELRMIARSYGK